MSRLHNYLEIVMVLGIMDLKLKYRSSKLGFLWSFLKPLLQFCVYYIVFAIFFHVGEGRSYALLLFLGVITWGFFCDGTGLGMNSYIGKKSIVTKININKVLMPIAAYITPALNFLLNFMMFFALYVALDFDEFCRLSIGKILTLLLVFLDMGVIIVALNIILANINALFRDVQNIWELVLQYGVFMTPILYPLPVPDQFLFPYFSINVLALPIEIAKAQLFQYNTKIYTDFFLFLAGHLVVVFALCLIAKAIHSKFSDKVADYI